MIEWMNEWMYYSPVWRKLRPTEKKIEEFDTELVAHHRALLSKISSEVTSANKLETFAQDPCRSTTTFLQYSTPGFSCFILPDCWRICHICQRRLKNLPDLHVFPWRHPASHLVLQFYHLSNGFDSFHNTPDHLTRSLFLHHCYNTI